MGAELAEIRIVWADHAGACVGRRGQYDLIQCEICGFCHAVPLPDPGGRASRDAAWNGGAFHR